MKNFLFIFAVLLSAKSFSQTAGFIVITDSGCAPLCTDFQDTSSNVVSRLWDFGDASQGSTNVAVTHCYVTPGVYTVTLMVTFANSTTGTATHTITVFPNPVANFTWTNVGNNTIQFTDQSIGATSWLWYFGDQTTSTVQNPVHTFSTAGLDTVLLEVANSSGCSDSTGIFIMVGIHEVSAEAMWSIYPNPSENGLFNIHIEGPEVQMITIENTLGECVLTGEISGNAILDLSNQPAGCYFVRMQDGTVQKILIR